MRAAARGHGEYHQPYQKQHQPFVVAKLDFSNAFNSVERGFILDIVDNEDLDGMLPWLIFRLHDLHVIFRDIQENVQDIESTCGVSQGCPLSPALFQLAISRILRNVREKRICKFVHSYLDDCTPEDKSMKAVFIAIDTIAEESGKVGLKLNLKKCQILAINHESEDMESAPENVSEAQWIEIKKRMSVIPVENEGTQVLGGFIGTDEYIHNAANAQMLEKVETIHLFKQFFEYINSIQFETSIGEEREPILLKAFRMLRWCGPSLATFLLRVTPPELCLEGRQAMDYAIVKALLALAQPVGTQKHIITGGKDVFESFPHGQLSKDYDDLLEFVNPSKDRSPRNFLIPNPEEKDALVSFLRVFSPIAGLGLGSAYFASAGAYIASIAQSAPTIQKVVEEMGLKPSHVLLSASELKMEVALEETAEARDLVRTWYDPTKAQSGIQAIINKKRMSLVFDRLVTLVEDDLGKTQRIISASDTWAGGWWKQLHSPWQKELEFTNQEIRDNICFDIGIEPATYKDCTRCGKVINGFYTHLTSSSCAQGSHAVAGEIFKVAGKYVTHSLGFKNSKNERYPDEFVEILPIPEAKKKFPDGTERFEACRADWVCTSTHHIFDASQVSASKAKSLDKAREVGYSANIRWEEKKKKYERSYKMGTSDGKELPIVPIVGEAFGAVARGTKEFIEKWHQFRKVNTNMSGQKICSLAKMKFMLQVGLRKALLAHVKRMRDFVKYDVGETSQMEDDKGETN